MSTPGAKCLAEEILEKTATGATESRQETEQELMTLVPDADLIPWTLLTQGWTQECKIREAWVIPEAPTLPQGWNPDRTDTAVLLLINGQEDNSLHIMKTPGPENSSKSVAKMIYMAENLPQDMQTQRMTGWTPI